MKLISLKNISDNMILARNAHARDGNVLLAKGALLKHNYAERLQEWGLNSVYVQDNQGEIVEIEEELCQQTKSLVLQIVNDFLADLNSEQLPDSLKQMIAQVMQQLLADGNVLKNLAELKAISDNLFRHDVTVSVLSTIMGTFAGYAPQQLQELATGAILIDLGKIGMASRLWDGSNQLSVQDSLELQKHTKRGFDRLRQLKGNYENSAQTILQHHEKFDGTGFPQGLKGNQIHEYARIAAIADLYDSYPTENNSQKVSPYSVIEYFEECSNTLFDPGMIRLFFQKVAPFLSSPEDSRLTEPLSTSNLSKPDRVNHKTDGGVDQHCEISQPKPVEREHYPVDNPKNSSSSHEVSSYEASSNEKHNPQKLEERNKNSEREKIRLDNPRNPGQREHHSVASKQGRTHLEVTAERCQQARTELLQVVDKTLSRISTELVPGKVLELTRTIINEVVSDSDVMSNLVTIQALGDNTFSHCVSVGLLSVMTGASLGYTPEQLKELGAGSLLLDLGKVELSEKYIVDASSHGTPEYAALMPEHTQLGFERLWALKRNTSIPYIALQHHERYDGSGFPAGLKGQQIHEFARIVALADIYDTLINEGIDGKKSMPHEVIEYIRDHSGSHYDPDLSRAFLQNVTPFLIGSNVLLNTGEKATVVKINKDLLARPVIRVMVDSAGNKLPRPIEKDLEKDLTLFIVSALKDDEL